MGRQSKKKKKQSAKVNHKQQQVQKQAMQPHQDGTLTFRIQAFDTWFFRESRPHDAAGASELSSLFPPPIRTLAGALRTHLGNQINIDWHTLTCPNSDFDFEKSLGNASHLGELQLRGAWIYYAGKRLYPAPYYLMQKENQEITRLIIGQKVHCDLGDVRLPEMPADLQGYKTLENVWITATGLRACLDGNVPKQTDIIQQKSLFSYEARLGIARDNTQRKVQDGKLYQTQHLRLKPEVQIELDASGLDPLLIAALPKQQSMIRLGGEGRMASLQVKEHNEPFPFTNPKKADRILIHFITPADFNGEMFPANFEQKEQDQQTVWQGDINGVTLTIEAAVIGKVHREGGWDMQNHRPRAVKASTDWQRLATALQGQCIGADTAYGRGQILIGQWQEQ